MNGLFVAWKGLGLVMVHRYSTDMQSRNSESPGARENVWSDESDFNRV